MSPKILIELVCSNLNAPPKSIQMPIKFSVSLLTDTNFRVLSNFMILFYCYHSYQSVGYSDKHVSCKFSINVNESKTV